MLGFVIVRSRGSGNGTRCQYSAVAVAIGVTVSLQGAIWACAVIVTVGVLKLFAGPAYSLLSREKGVGTAGLVCSTYCGTKNVLCCPNSTLSRLASTDSEGNTPDHFKSSPRCFNSISNIDDYILETEC